MENKNSDPNGVNNTINENEKDLLLDYDFDGIKELDNPPPPWLMWVFYITIIWAAGYIAYFHLFDEGDLQAAEYKNEIAEAAEKYKPVELSADQLVLLTNDADLGEGKDIYAKNCVACHGANGEGGIGSDFRDAEWIYGNKPENLFHIIKNGTSKGMTKFNSLPDESILKVTSYILVKLNKEKIETTNADETPVEQDIKEEG